MSFFESQRPYVAVLSLLAAMVSLQSGASVAKQLFPLVGPEGTTSLRLLFAALILILVWHPWRTLPKGREWYSIFIYGIALGGMNLFFYLAIARVPLGIGIAIGFTGPLAAALLTSKRANDLVWVACAILGLVLLLPFTKTSIRLDGLGIVFALAMALCWVLYILYGQKVGTSVPGGAAVALGMTVAALLVLPIGIASAGSALRAWEILPIALTVAVLSSALPYSLEMVALKTLPTKTFSILLSLEPALGALSGLIFLNEILSLLQWFGIGLVIFASVGSTLSPSKQRLEIAS